MAEKKVSTNGNIELRSSVIKSYSADRTFIKYQTKIYIDGEDEVLDEEYGSFEIEGEGFNKGKPMSMTINIHDSLTNKGLSRQLIRETCNLIIKNCPEIRPDQMILIDGDGSGGFWDYIGMKDNRYYSTKTLRDLETKGYEKEISFLKLCQFGDKGLAKGIKEKTKNLKKRRKLKKTNKKKKTKKRKTKKRKTKKRKTKK